MIRFLAQILFVLALAAQPVAAQTQARVSTNAPITNFSLPTFTNPDGFRDWLIRGSEARPTDQNGIDVKDLTLTIFSRDAANRIDTMLLSPQARILPDQQVVTGDSSLRVIRLTDGFEATGEGWRYIHQEKTKTETVSLARNVRVVIHAELQNLLK